jgi:hypothetical protein
MSGHSTCASDAEILIRVLERAAHALTAQALQPAQAG